MKDRLDILGSQFAIRFVVILISVVIGYFTLQMIDQNNLTLTLLLLVVPIALFYLGLVFYDPIISLYTLFYANYFAIGLTRYIPAPLGLSIDALLMLTLFAIWIKSFYQNIEWKRANNQITWISAIWFAFTFLQLVNPIAESKTAWFYAMRGIALHMLLMVPLTLVMLRKHSQLHYLIILWGIFTILAVVKGTIQLYVGLDPFEARWMAAGAYRTHILFGRLRVFSFLSDAGTFGAAMGQATIVFGILAFGTKNKTGLRIFYLIVAGLSLYGLAISGTRGALAVIFGGLALYILIRRNIRTIIIGGIIGLMMFGFLRYTYIGNSNYTINRMRTAVNPKADASYQVRLENQRTLRNYMKGKPFGAGVGSSGNWGLRFTPHTVLANTPTDSWYVMIWVEQGIVGLVVHILLWLYVVFKGLHILMVRKIPEELKLKLSALHVSVFGILLASYANSYLGQMPIGLISYITVALVFVADEIIDDMPQKAIAEDK